MMNNVVELPPFVAEYIESHYGDKVPTSWDKADLLRDWENYMALSGRKDVRNWVKNADNYLTFVIAVSTNNYIIRPEKTYYWRKKQEHCASFEPREYTYLNHYHSTEQIGLSSFGESHLVRSKFTESGLFDLIGDDINLFDKVEVDLVEKYL